MPEMQAPWLDVATVLNDALQTDCHHTVTTSRLDWQYFTIIQITGQIKDCHFVDHIEFYVDHVELWRLEHSSQLITPWGLPETIYGPARQINRMTNSIPIEYPDLIDCIAQWLSERDITLNLVDYSVGSPS